MTGRAKKAAAPKKKANGYKMPAPIPSGEVIHDTIGKKKWRIGPSIGVGGFGEIYSACEHDSSPKKGSSYPFVVKIEPHENGPLFVEKHFYIRNANRDDVTQFMKSKKLSSLGMPLYFGNGSHTYNGEKYRYLVLERYGKDVWSLFKECGKCFSAAAVFQLGLQLLDVLEYIHSRGYVHADIKGANILMGMKKGTENQAYLVDFGLAMRVNDKEFKPDPKCAHNGTIEYTSRDAHLGVATMRGDLEILGYNMLKWLVSQLPWETVLNQPKTVQSLKEEFMKNVRSRISADYPAVPDALIKFFEYINSLKPKDQPDITKCQRIFLNYLKAEGKTRSSKIEFTANKSATKHVADDKTDKLNGAAPKVRRGRKPKVTVPDSEDEEDEKPLSRRPKTVVPDSDENDTESDDQQPAKNKKRKSIEQPALTRVKKTKISPKVTPPAKKNHANISTQTSVEKRRSPRQVSFDSPVCAVLGNDPDTSADMFDESWVQEKKAKPKRKLLSAEEVTVKRVVRKKTTVVAKKGKSWKDCPTIMNGRSPPE